MRNFKYPIIHIQAVHNKVGYYSDVNDDIRNYY